MSAATYYLWYDAAGRIVRLAYCLPAEREANGRADLPYVAHPIAADPERYWVEGGAVALRPMQVTALNGLTLASLPDPCEIAIDGVRYPCTGGTATLSFGQPGTHRVRVEAFPFLPAEFEVTT
ncbi:MAG: hypothetical protein A3H93_18090 [Rhodocyclales bacterium RIFCSPLOWO2_02_FULL_63_24]|nr:MAG: hypothetical protein A3H93_18090 [Rhodocyclales bacterium RIFCSPLOWO2_02_FULL_63_24]